MMQIYVLRIKQQNTVEAFESQSDAVNTGVDFIQVVGNMHKWSESKINDEVSRFTQSNNSELVEFYCCNLVPSIEE